MENENNIFGNKLNENPFSVPEGYFRNMRNRASVLKQSRRTGRIVPLLSVAAAVVVLVAGIWAWTAKSEFAADAVQMSDEEIIAYLIYSGVEVEDIVLQVEN